MPLRDKGLQVLSLRPILDWFFSESQSRGRRGRLRVFRGLFLCGDDTLGLRFTNL